MQRLFKNKAAVKRSVLVTTFIALSVWGGSLLLTPEERTSVPITTSTTTPTKPPTTSQQGKPQVYWLRADRNKLTLVAKSLPPNTDNASSSQQVLTTTMQKLLAAQPSEDLSSTIPKGTKLRSLEVRADGVHVDLSQEFRAGGGSTSIIYRVAQVIYTASSLDPNAKIFVSIEGQPIDEKHPLGGEGLTLRQPITRDRFTEDFSIAK
jgi:spore germination protein GerM